MTILFAHKAEPSWIEPLKSYGIKFDIYPEISNPEEITFVLSSKLPKGLVEKLPNLKCISAIGAGVNNLLDDKQIADNIVITRVVDDYLSSQLVHYCVLSVLSNIRDWNSYMNSDYSRKWIRNCLKNTKELTIGIMGIGAIGSKIARAFVNLDFKVKGLSKSSKSESFPCYSFNEIDLFLENLDFLICILPLTDETIGICSKKLFSKLRNCFFINVGRGEHVVENDLLDALNSNLSGAILDVFNKEPLDLDHAFWSHPKITVTPHIAARSDPKYLLPQMIENYKKIMKGESPDNKVDRTKGY